MVTPSIGNVVRFWINLRAGRERKLPGHNNGLARLDAAFDHGHVAVLPLARFYRTKIDSVVRFHHKNKRAPSG